MRQENKPSCRTIERPPVADRGRKSQSVGGLDFLEMNDLVLVGGQHGEDRRFARLGGDPFENGASDPRKRPARNDLMCEKMAFRAELVDWPALRNVARLA